MRAPLPRVLATIATAVLTLTLGASSAGLAQDSTDEPVGTPSPFCGVLTEAEASAALGLPLTIGTSTDLNCSFDSDFKTTDLSLDVSREEGPLSDDYPRSYYRDGIDVPCVQPSTAPDASATGPVCPAAMVGDHLGGRPAYYDAESTILFVDEGDNGQLFVLQLFGPPPDQIDVPTALMSLAEAALPRLASIPVPPVPTDAPAPSFFGDAVLSAMMPTDIGGSPVDVQTMSGVDIQAQMAADPDYQAQMQDLQDKLTSKGLTLNDLSIAYGSFPTDTSFGTITAVRLKGADIAGLTDDLLPLVFTDVVNPVQTAAVIGGKNVIVVTDGPLQSGAPSGSPGASQDPYALTPDRAYAYPHGEVLWLVSVDEPALTEVFQKLP